MGRRLLRRPHVRRRTRSRSAPTSTGRASPRWAAASAATCATSSAATRRASARSSRTRASSTSRRCAARATTARTSRSRWARRRWEDREEFEKHSPHRFVTNWKTPTLVIHGEKDYRVPISEGAHPVRRAARARRRERARRLPGREPLGAEARATSRPGTATCCASSASICEDPRDAEALLGASLLGAPARARAGHPIDDGALDDTEYGGDQPGAAAFRREADVEDVHEDVPPRSARRASFAVGTCAWSRRASTGEPIPSKRGTARPSRGVTTACYEPKSGALVMIDYGVPSNPFFVQPHARSARRRREGRPDRAARRELLRSRPLPRADADVFRPRPARAAHVRPP